MDSPMVLGVQEEGNWCLLQSRFFTFIISFNTPFPLYEVVTVRIPDLEHILSGSWVHIGTLSHAVEWAGVGVEVGGVWECYSLEKEGLSCSPSCSLPQGEAKHTSWLPGAGHMLAPEWLRGQLYEAENLASTPGNNHRKVAGLVLSRGNYHHALIIQKSEHLTLGIS